MTFLVFNSADVPSWLSWGLIGGPRRFVYDDGSAACAAVVRYITARPLYRIRVRRK
jgi:hypothetical protein